jgi:hypothetical protein
MLKNGFDLVASASAEMVREGFVVGYPDGCEAQVAAIRAALGADPDVGARDLRGLMWSSIDNDTSRDLDQVEMAERVDGGIRDCGCCGVGVEGQSAGPVCPGTDTDGVHGGAKFFDAAYGAFDGFDVAE